MSAKVSEIYERYIKALSADERLELLALVAQGLVDQGSHVTEQATHSILELHGLVKEIWEGIDAQDYVHRLRDEWERPA